MYPVAPKTQLEPETEPTEHTYCEAAIEDEGELGLELPTALDATTVNVYEVPGVRPVTVIGDEDPVAVMLPGLEVTVNDVAAGPLLAGVNATTTCPRLPPLETESIAAKSGCKNDLTNCDP